MNLRQINQQAAENAAQALTKLVRAPVAVHLKRLGEYLVTNLHTANDPEQLVAAVQLPITGEVQGSALLSMAQAEALALSDLMYHQPSGTTRTFTVDAKAAIKEAGNILCGRYLAALSDALELKLIENLPHLSLAMFGAVVEGVVSRLGKTDVLAIEVEIAMQDQSVTALFFVLFNLASDRIIAERLRALLQ